MYSKVIQLNSNSFPKSHGWRSLVGCSPWGRWELDTTERLHFHFSFSFIGEGNGNPLHSSCLENPGDGGAWWAAVYGVAQSQTLLKWLSSKQSSLCYTVGPCSLLFFLSFLLVYLFYAFIITLSSARTRSSWYFYWNHIRTTDQLWRT